MWIAIIVPINPKLRQDAAALDSRREREAVAVAHSLE
jgi:hypothetical protein